MSQTTSPIVETLTRIQTKLNQTGANLTTAIADIDGIVLMASATQIELNSLRDRIAVINDQLDDTVKQYGLLNEETLGVWTQAVALLARYSTLRSAIHATAGPPANAILPAPAWVAPPTVLPAPPSVTPPSIPAQSSGSLPPSDEEEEREVIYNQEHVVYADEEGTASTDEDALGGEDEHAVLADDEREPVTEEEGDVVANDEYEASFNGARKSGVKKRARRTSVSSTGKSKKQKVVALIRRPIKGMPRSAKDASALTSTKTPNTRNTPMRAGSSNLIHKDTLLYP
ncbi:hypothetical protein BDN72DRAFT_864320 [Pluteus cervinus]|uniref:Uncharacterized protein n=1 Tax=Pluteus cervinus TaxID=181527 RepID=A0ACD3A5A5_9AGAR|nr:hypothetical protein BDN72DRAFT_864320 [Pluteus cervinus]